MTHLQQHSATTLARELTAATGLHFRPHWRSDPIQAIYGANGLLWQCNIGRWSGQDPWVLCKGHGLPVKALAYKMGEENARGRGWQARAAAFFGTAVIESNNLWHRSVAEMLESVPGAAIVRLMGRAAVYDKQAPPPDVWCLSRDSNGDLYTNPVVQPPEWARAKREHHWTCSAEDMLVVLWTLYERSHDPPGYVWTAHGEEGELRWSAQWGGEQKRTHEDLAMLRGERFEIRAAMWADFWKNNRGASTHGLKPIMREP